MNIDADTFSFSLSGLLSSFVFGVIGLWMFGRAKKNINYAVIFISMGLMGFPYFTSGPWQDWGVGFVLCCLAYFFW